MLIGLLSACSTGSLGFGKSLASNGIKCLSWKNQTSQVSLMFTDKNSNEPLIIHLLSVLISMVEVLLQFKIHMLEYVL